MATTNSGNGRKKPVDIVCIFQKQLKNDKETSKSLISSTISLIESQQTVRGYKLCCLEMGEKTYRFYQDIDNYELFDIHKSCEIIQVNVDAYSKKNADLGKIIKDSSKMLNDLKAKLQEANNSACAMHNCLKSILGFPDDNVPVELSDVTRSAKSLSENGQKAAEAMVEIAGIQTFSNVDNLKSFAQKLGLSVKTLKTLTDEYIKKAGEDNKTAQTELTKIIEDLNKTEFDNFEATSGLNGQETTLEFLCEGVCYPIERVEEICILIDKENGGVAGKASVSSSRKTGDKD